MAFDRSVPGRRGRLCVYLILSCTAAYLAHMPVHHGPTRPTDPLIPAAAPWAIAAAVAFSQTAPHRSLDVAWLILIAASAFFLAAHLLHRH